MELKPTALSASTRLFLSWVETFFALLVGAFPGGKILIRLICGESDESGEKIMYLPA